LKELQSKIDGASRAIESQANAAEVARDAIEELREVVSPLLAAVADNGEVSQLGVRALKNAVDRKQALANDPQLTDEQRQILTRDWELRIQATTDAVGELERERIKFHQLMLYLQNQEHFIGELEAIKKQDEVIKTIKDLAKALGDMSVDVNNIITSLTRPGV